MCLCQVAICAITIVSVDDSPSLVYQTHHLLDSPKVRISKVFILWSFIRLHYLHHQEGLQQIPVSFLGFTSRSTLRLSTSRFTLILPTTRFIEDLYQVSICILFHWISIQRSLVLVRVLCRYSLRWSIWNTHISILDLNCNLLQVAIYFWILIHDWSKFISQVYNLRLVTQVCDLRLVFFCLEFWIGVYMRRFFGQAILSFQLVFGSWSCSESEVDILELLFAGAHPFVQSF